MATSCSELALRGLAGIRLNQKNIRLPCTEIIAQSTE